MGPMCDVMWARPDGRRVLVVGSPEVGEFISAVYRFDAVRVVSMECRWDGWVLSVTADDLSIAMRAVRGWSLPLRRTRSFAAARWIEGPVARLLFGVRVSGTSPTGIHEWYRADRYRPLTEARAVVGGEDAGRLSRFTKPARFGFSEPPRRPSIVHVRPRLTDPSGRLGRVVARPG